MIGIFALLLIFCFLAIIIGLIKPQLIIKWGAIEKRTRGKVVTYYGLGVVLSVILLGVFADDSETKKDNVSIPEKTRVTAETQQSPASTSTVNNKPLENVEATKKSEETPPKKETTKTVSATTDVKWNLSEPDASLNGNVELGIEMVKQLDNLNKGEPVSANEVIKAPWDYYGKALTFTGTVEAVTDFPPTSDDIRTGDVVIKTTDGTIVEFFSTVSSGAIQVGDELTLTGFPTGRMEVDNELGGSYTHLIMVTNYLN